jgi:cytochrome c1
MEVIKNDGVRVPDDPVVYFLDAGLKNADVWISAGLLEAPAAPGRENWMEPPDRRERIHVPPRSDGPGTDDMGRTPEVKTRAFLRSR